MSKPTLAFNVATAFRLCNEQQARLDAIAAIVDDQHTQSGSLGKHDWLRSIGDLARGTPAREVRAALKRYGRKAK